MQRILLSAILPEAGKEEERNRMTKNELLFDQMTRQPREDLQVSLTDRQYEGLLLTAYENGFENAEQLLVSFISDLTGWYKKGTNEQRKANEWINLRCWDKQKIFYFRYFLYYHDYSSYLSLSEINRDEDCFVDIYKQYKKEAGKREIEDAPTCISLIQQLLEEDILQTDYSVSEKAKSIMKIMEARGEILTDDERALLMLYAEVTNDISKAVAYIHELSEQKSSNNPGVDEILLKMHRDIDAGKAAVPEKKLEPETEPFQLPNANYDYDRIYRYLCEERKLSREVVQFFVDRRMIYESVKTHNVVFVGRDAEGIARHASLRGTYNPKNGKPFKGVLPGSNAEYSFNLINTSSDVLIVCEAPIDCMSYMDFTRDLLHQEGEKVLCNNYLALTGTHDRALERFLRDNPHVKEIRLALDTDDPGRKACEKIIEKYTSGEWKKRGFKIMIDPPGEYKNWNEFLIEMHKARIEFECQQAIEKDRCLNEEMKQILQKEHLRFDEVRGVLIDEVDIQNLVSDKANAIKRTI